MGLGVWGGGPGGVNGGRPRVTGGSVAGGRPGGGPGGVNTGRPGVEAKGGVPRRPGVKIGARGSIGAAELTPMHSQ